MKLAKAAGFEYEGKPKRSEVTDDLLSLEAEDEEVEELEEDDELEEEEPDEVDELEVDEELEEDEIEEPAPKKKPAAKAPAKKAAAKPKSTEGEETLAAKQVAFELGIEAKTLRQFFRSPASTIEPVGSGGRYEFLLEDLPKIKAEFEKWRAEHAARGSKRGPGKKASAPVEEIEEIEEVEELEIEELDEEIDDEELELED